VLFIHPLRHVAQLVGMSRHISGTYFHQECCMGREKLLTFN
jgi:hypothetical protein